MSMASLLLSPVSSFTYSLDETRAEPSGTLRIVKLRRANSVQRALNYLIGPEGIVIQTATRIL
jgi:hypothetical protein